MFREPLADEIEARRKELLELGKLHPERRTLVWALVAGIEIKDGEQVPAWLERAKKDRWDTQTQTEVAEFLQSEINRRDRIIAEKNDWWSNEVCRRDVIIDGLRQEQEWMRSGWRRFIIRKPPAAVRKSSE